MSRTFFTRLLVVSLSAEDGDWQHGTFTFGVGMALPTANHHLSPAGASPDNQPSC